MKQLPKNHIELAGQVTIGPRGQVVIPSEVRHKLNLKPGDHMLALYIADSESVAFVHRSKLQDLINQSSGELTHTLSEKIKPSGKNT
ncbi:AbrB/MazE/SpoVT family DNA-binding domain-containing protein [Candidatus Saccharibacteria bacterium]|nr:AbrB/MazE/SpoVT family DNA-binding domain-containing protein [Candidatus Saccharibacteria bacterium]